MKKKFPEWWAFNRQYFVLVGSLFFLPKKIRKPFTVLVAAVDALIMDDDFELMKPVHLKDFLIED
jgi:hypothetical protein